MTDQIDRLTVALADRYTIEQEIGVGGMATVYLAEDVKHERKVALKVLRPELAAVLGVERFLREIKLTARLNHPHILPLLDSGEANHVLFYVMPYVQGESLRQKLNRETQLSIDDALRLTRQVAAALHHAHQYGVMHRDIKPENILLHEGEAMVADFGIALALNAAGGDRLTETGLSVGTPEYMSPEQASGDKQLDARSDVYALGCLLHEMLVGDPPFTGPSVQAVIARQVLDPPPSIRTVRASVSAEVEHVVQRALAKAPADRWQTASEFAARVKSASTHAGEIFVPPAPKDPAAGLKRVALVAGAVSVTAALVVGSLMFGIGKGERPAPQHTQLTFNGNVSWAEISPDGELLAYVEEGQPGRLLVEDLTSASVIEIAYTRSRTSTLRWSPDGSSLLFAGTEPDGERVKVIYPRLGGAPRPLPDEFGRDWFLNAVWAPDGSRLAGWRTGTIPGANAVEILSLNTGEIRSVEIPDSIGPLFYPGDWSPNGEFIALGAYDGGANVSLWTVAVDGSGWRRLMQDTLNLWAPRWAPTGGAVYTVRGIIGEVELLKISMGPQGQALGDPERLQVGVGAPYVFGGVSVTSDGRKLVSIRQQVLSNVWLSTSASGDSGKLNTVQLTRGTGLKPRASMSPDGNWIAYVEFRGTVGDVFIIPTEGGTPKRVTSSGEAFDGPVWSPDGTMLAFGRKIGGRVKVQTVLVNGQEVRTYEDTEIGEGGLAWAPGDRILYSRPGNRNFHRLNTQTGTQEPLVANDSVGWMFNPHYSPDGQRVAVYWNRPPQRGVWIITPRESSQRFFSGGFVYPMGWTADGRLLYVQEEGSSTIFRVPIASGEPDVIITLPFETVGAGLRCAAAGPSDDPVFLCAVAETIRDAWMVDNFDPEVR